MDFLEAPRVIPSTEDVRRTILHGFETWGAGSIEVEFRLGKIPKSKFIAIIDALSKCPTIHEIPRTKTREEFNGTEARMIRDIVQDGTLENERTIYKKKLVNMGTPGGTRLQVSLERPGSPNTERPYTMYRIKDRRSFVFEGVWRFDLTAVETNDPRYSDADDFMYEAEIELITQSDAMYYFTVEHLLAWGTEISKQLHEL